mgnify:CR=1 FL=1
MVLGYFSAYLLVVAVIVFDFYFVPPMFTLAVSDTQYVVTFGVMLLTGVLTILPPLIVMTVVNKGGYLWLYDRDSHELVAKAEVSRQENAEKCHGGDYAAHLGPSGCSSVALR